jgi:hypothetical protein
MGEKKPVKCCVCGQPFPPNSGRPAGVSERARKRWQERMARVTRDMELVRNHRPKGWFVG